MSRIKKNTPPSYFVLKKKRMMIRSSYTLLNWSMRVPHRFLLSAVRKASRNFLFRFFSPPYKMLMDRVVEYIQQVFTREGRGGLLDEKKGIVGREKHTGGYDMYSGSIYNRGRMTNHRSCAWHKTWLPYIPPSSEYIYIRGCVYYQSGFLAICIPPAY